MPPIEPILSPEVREAQVAARAVVALESTLISHGLPWPANLDTARDAESAVRAAGATPATIAVIDGALRVGLNDAELERLARADAMFKAGRRDLPWLVAGRHPAATTVGTTMFVANRAGISIMATGGIGGVHRGANETGDVSADLIELARTPVAVVCSGAKSILDLPRTLEFLETYGVPVIGFRTDKFPAFFAASSGLRLEQRVDSPREAAAVIDAARRLRLTAGIVIANPPPPDHALPADELERWIAVATADAARTNVTGKSLTPFLLDRLRQLSDGRTLDVNRALIVANARLAAEIAVELGTLAPQS